MVDEVLARERGDSVAGELGGLGRQASRPGTPLDESLVTVAHILIDGLGVDRARESRREVAGDPIQHRLRNRGSTGCREQIEHAVDVIGGDRVPDQPALRFPPQDSPRGQGLHVM